MCYYKTSNEYKYNASVVVDSIFTSGFDVDLLMFRQERYLHENYWDSSYTSRMLYSTGQKQN